MKKSSICLVVFLLVSINVFSADKNPKSYLPSETSVENFEGELLNSISENISSLDYSRNYINDDTAPISSEELRDSEEKTNIPAEKLLKEDLVDMSASAMGVGIF